RNLIDHRRHDWPGARSGPAIHRGDEQHAFVVEMQAADLLERRVEQHEALAVLIDADHFARGAGADDEVAALVEGERRGVYRLRSKEGRAFAVRGDLVDDASFSG